jgi:hypothetical protein
MAQDGPLNLHRILLMQLKKNMRKTKVDKPNRVSYVYKQTINGTKEEIMPLYCPVKELDWCENWNPKAVFSNSGLVEKDCIFITSDGETDIVWIVTDYDIEKGHDIMMDSWEKAMNYYLETGEILTGLPNF